MTIAYSRPDDVLPGHADGDQATRAVVLAGGLGTRLAPYTSILPKPLMPIGDRSILEVVIEQLAQHGVRDVTLCVGYLAHLIRAVLDNSAYRSADITYVHEPKALGTAGPLRLIDGLDSTFIVMNGDVLTTLDYGALVRHHRESGNMLTIATHSRTVKIDYGVINLDGPTAAGGRRVEGYVEKPEFTSMVSMGVYVLEPSAVQYVPPGSYFDFPHLVQALLAAGEPVGAYLHEGLWFDIGRPDDYHLASTAWEEIAAVGRSVQADLRG